jgi:hypothetical protein
MSNYFYTQNTEDGVVQTLETPYNPTVLNHTTSSPISSNNIIVSSNAGSTPISSLFNNNNQPNLVNTIPDTNSDTFSSIFSNIFFTVFSYSHFQRNRICDGNY